jgi:hypothetical protein
MEAIDGRILCLASSPFIAVEMIWRFNREIILSPIPPWTLDDPNHQLDIGPEIDDEQLLIFPLAEMENAPQFGGIIWAAPVGPEWKNVLKALSPFFLQALKINIIGTSRIQNVLPGHRNKRLKNLEPSIPSSILMVALKNQGLYIDKIYGYQGPLSIFYGILNRFPASLGRTDLVDRLNFAIRRHYLVTDWQARLSTAWMLVAKTSSFALSKK